MMLLVFGGISHTGNTGPAMEATSRIMKNYNQNQTAKVPSLPFDQQDTQRITPTDTLKLHLQHKKWLEAALRSPYFNSKVGKTIAATHTASIS